jgi:membrane-anchored protein YejM (alkaline phosphatase superfamily)
VRLGKTLPGEAELGWVRRLYRGELQIVDEAVGELVAELREKQRLDDAIVVVVGVHGEEFFEHGGAGHDRTLFEESLRVPLIIHAPEVLAPGRVTVPVDLLDLAPTLADLTGVPVPDGWQGESLVPVIDDPQPPPRLVVAYLGDGSRAGIVGDHKLVLGAGGRETYFDLDRNAAEAPAQDDVGGIGLRIVRTALAWQLTHEARWRRARWGTGANLRPAFAQDLGM